MWSYRLGNLTINIERDGANQFAKASHQIKVGKYSEIITPKYEFTFNLNGEIKFIRGFGANWRHPGEMLKRTDGNDWVFYSLGSVGERIFTWLGEYYLPCLPYASNPVWEFNPFTDMNIMQAFGAWAQLYANLSNMPREGLAPQAQAFIELVCQSDDTTLYKRAQELHAIIGGRPSVLPPDTRHADYETVPLTIADGCRYHCKFCSVKTTQRLETRSRQNILEQIVNLKNFYGRNLANYKALFLANHDALGADGDTLCWAASEAVTDFGMDNPNIFMFGSVDSLLNTGNRLWEQINQLPAYTYINLGFESADTPTLKSIGKPLDAAKVQAAFQKMLQFNHEYDNLEITGNFLLGEQFSPDHYDSLAKILSSVPGELGRKGAVYLSPLVKSRNRLELLQTFFDLQKSGPLPAYVYLIQRL